MNSWSNCSCVITRLSDGWMFAACPTFLGSYLEKYENGGGGGVSMRDSENIGSGNTSDVCGKLQMLSLSAVLRSGQVQYSTSDEPVLRRECL